jgi:SH3-like domain-containing protein
MRVMRSLLAAFATVCASGAHAAEFRTVADSAVVMYDAPSKASTPMYVASRYYPLEVIVNLDAWVKVRDHTGTLSWVEKKFLAERRMVIVTTPNVDILSRAEEGAPPAFKATQNVALDLVEIVPGGWLRVRHADGGTGYLKSALVWGL